MSLVSKAIAALFNGVSQQPATMRLPSQCEEMVNAYPTVASGVGKRPSTQHIAKLTGVSGDAFVHIIDRDGAEKYLVIITDGTVRTFNLLTGAVVDVVDEVSDGYLDVPDGKTARETFQVVTLADYSFIVNKFITVEAGAIPTAEPEVFDDWFFPDNWTQASDSSRYYVGVPGTNKGSVQTMVDLPTAGGASPPSEGDYYEILGDDSSGFTKYYVIYRGGVWVETHVMDGDKRLVESTMPHALVRESDGDFHLRQFGWVPRLVGDDNSNALPSFVGKEIKDVAFHKNRLAFCAGENVVFSAAGDFGNFFRTTVTQLLDSDRVDVAVSSISVSNINHLLPAQNGMMFFSDRVQYVLNVDELLTPTTVSIDVATSYEMNPAVPPMNIGQDVYFAVENGDFTRIREYTLGDGGELATDATDITAHVPRYLPSGAVALAGSSNEDLLLVLSHRSGYENRVYPYKFFYSSGEKVQSAWSYWEFAADDIVRAFAMIESEIYFVIERADGTYLEKMNVQSTDYPLSLSFDILLDRRHQFESGEKSYDGSSKTTFTLPYPLTTAEQADYRFVLGDGAAPGRMLATNLYTWTSSTTCDVTGNFASNEVFGGLNYVMSYQFSQQFFPRRDGVVTTGRYQLRTFTIYFQDTAFFKTYVAPYGAAQAEDVEAVVTTGLAVFTGKTLGSDALTTDAPVFETGTYSFQIYGDSRVATVRLVNDQPYQANFVSAEVEGFYSNRSRAM